MAQDSKRMAQAVVVRSFGARGLGASGRQTTQRCACGYHGGASSIPFAFLAPDIVEAILRGKQPIKLTPEKLKRLRNLPKSWEEQRKLLKFTS